MSCSIATSCWNSNYGNGLNNHLDSQRCDTTLAKKDKSCFVPKDFFKNINNEIRQFNKIEHPRLRTVDLP